LKSGLPAVEIDLVAAMDGGCFGCFKGGWSWMTYRGFVAKIGLVPILASVGRRT
jgi:hypothetical protein